MSRLVQCGTLLMVLILSGVGTAEAQQHTVTDAELNQAVTAEVDREAADRAVLKDVLARPEVRAVAEDAGLELERAQQAVDQLEPGEAQRLASMAVDVEDQLAGGQSITITTTAIVIVLLILILLIVA